MKVHITNLYGMAYNSVAQISQQMVARIGVENFNFNELGIYSYYDANESEEALSSRYDGILASVGANDVIIFQTPTWNTNEWEVGLFNRTFVYENVKRIIFIHDVIPLMFESNYYLLDRFIDMYNRADLLIVPSQQMLDYLREHGLTTKKILIQHMWDHVCQIDPLIQPANNKTISFIGNIEKKTQSLMDWDSSAVTLQAFSDPAEWGQGKNVRFVGWQDDSLLINFLRRSGGFGLLWGDKDDWVKYMRLNCSYKLSTYLAAGIPVIVRSDTPEVEKIRDKHLGIIADDLDTAVNRVAAMTDDEYNQMRDAIADFSPLIRDGYFTKHLLADVVYKVLYD